MLSEFFHSAARVDAMRTGPGGPPGRELCPRALASRIRGDHGPPTPPSRGAPALLGRSKRCGAFQLGRAIASPIRSPPPALLLPELRSCGPQPVSRRPPFSHTPEADGCKQGRHGAKLSLRSASAEWLLSVDARPTRYLPNHSLPLQASHSRVAQEPRPRAGKVPCTRPPAVRARGQPALRMVSGQEAYDRASSVPSVSHRAGQVCSGLGGGRAGARPLAACLPAAPPPTRGRRAPHRLLRSDLSCRPA